jgi:hypothetical protein
VVRPEGTTAVGNEAQAESEGATHAEGRAAVRVDAVQETGAAKVRRRWNWRS